jgi:hypothetical protein
MQLFQHRIEKCPVCGCNFNGPNSGLTLDWVSKLKSEDGFVPLFRCYNCFSPFYIKRKDGTLETYLGGDNM